MVVKVKVLYCGGWGYAPKFRRLESNLLKEFEAGELQIEGEYTPEITGYMEVSVNGQLVHSKKNGDGHVDSDAKMKKICDAISAAL